LPERPANVLKRDGMAFVCASDDVDCVARAKVLAQAEPKSRTVESTIVRGTGGRLGEPQRYMIVLVPPQ
jgi:hypothetical protein